MFFIKRKINKYLRKKNQLNTFDLLLKDYVFGNLKRNLVSNVGIKKIKIGVKDLDIDSRKIFIKSKINGRYKEVIVNEADIACGDDNINSFKHYKIDNIEIVYSIIIRHFSDK